MEIRKQSNKLQIRAPTKKLSTPTTQHQEDCPSILAHNQDNAEKEAQHLAYALPKRFILAMDVPRQGPHKLYWWTRSTASIPSQHKKSWSIGKTPHHRQVPFLWSEAVTARWAM